MEVIEPANGESPWILSKENTAAVEANKFEVAAVWKRRWEEQVEKYPAGKGDDYHKHRDGEEIRRSNSTRSQARERRCEEMRGTN